MNVSNLELILVQKISNSTSTLDTLIYSKALQELKTGTVTVVNTTADLPNPNTAFIGHLFYEKTTEAMYIVDQQGYARKIEAGTNLYSWGTNGYGQLGDGTTTSRSSPGTVAGGGNNWKVISGFRESGGNATVGAIKSDGTLWTWGQGCLGSPPTSSRSSPATVSIIGANWCSVSASTSHFAALKIDGSLWMWGQGTQGQLGFNNTSTLSAPTKLLDGFTWCRVVVGGVVSAGIASNGSLWTWGSNNNGQLGDGTITSRSSPGTTAGGGTNWCVIDITNSAGTAIKTDGSLWTWGTSGYGQLGDGTTTSRSSPGTTAGAGNNWCAVSQGAGHTVAVKTDGTLWSWGRNEIGQLGDGTTTSRSSPGTVAGGGTTWCAIAAGLLHTAAIKTDGTLWTWGCNSCGELGNGTTTNRCSPNTVVGDVTNWSKVSATFRSTIAIRNFQ